MTAKEVLLKQFTAAYDENGWFVALQNAIEGLNASQAAWKTENIDNSIWEILSHLNYYNYAYLERFKGVDYVYPASNNDETFTAEKTEEAWLVETEKFNFIMKDWRHLLETADEAKFDQPVSKNNQALWGILLSNINLHNAYHAGQIVLLKKLQGIWDSNKGVS